MGGVGALRSWVLERETLPDRLGRERSVMGAEIGV